MLLLAAHSDLTQQLSNRLHKLHELIFSSIGDPDQRMTLAPGQALSDHTPDNHWAVLRNGTIRGLLQGTAVVESRPGDMLTLTGGYGLPDLEYIAQTPSEVALYQIDRVLKYLHEDKRRAAQWTALLLTQISFFQQGLQAGDDEQQTGTGFLQFAPGDTIIKEGDLAGEVYHVVQGHADVYRGGVVVGEVLPGELFGAMAMLCGLPRTATVIARDEVLVAAVPQSDFQGLIQQHPETAVTLMENMARAINDLNDRLETSAKHHH